ncbi:MAG: hypothetical protein KDC34_17870, partial [Saprospiraceae bacterium]|nr:hypothetical protein [Saprospiraceae bacterium]
QDSRGFMWISSIEGLNRYDGRTVKVYKSILGDTLGMQDNIVTSTFFEDPVGNLWFTTYEGINCYQRSKDRVSGFRLNDVDGNALQQDYYLFHMDASGKLWLRVGTGTQGMLHLYDTQTGKDSIICGLNGQRQWLWFNNNKEPEAVLSSMSESRGGVTLTSLKKGNTTRAYLEDDLSTHNCYVQRADQIWICSDQGLVLLNPLSGESSLFDQWQEEDVGTLWSVIPSGDRYLFVSSFTKGLLVFDRKEQVFCQQFLPHPQDPFSLGSEWIRELYLDAQQTLWASEWGKGLYFANLHKTKFYFFKESKGVRAAVIDVGPDGNIWCSTVEGILVFDTSFQFVGKHEWMQVGNQKEELPTVSQFFNSQDGQFWANRSGKLFRWDREANIFVKDQEFSRGMASVWNLRDGRILFAEFGGLSELIPDLKGGLKKSSFEPVSRIELEYPTRVYEDLKGYLYVADNAERLLILKPGQEKYEQVGLIPETGYCKGFFEDVSTGIVWVASSQGLIRILPENQGFERMNELEHGVPAEDFYAVFGDRKGRLWLSGNRGLIVFDPREKKFQRFGPPDGLQGNEFNNYSGAKDLAGNIWFGGMNGINAFSPETINPIPFEPRIQFVRLLINDEPYTDSIPISELTGLSLPYYQNTLSFEFVGMEFSNPEAITYKYMLEGYDRSWVDNERRGFVRYANLPPGSYTFLVKSANSDGHWSESSKAFGLYIKRPFWLSWWFYALCALAVFGLVYAWIWYRLQQALKIERMRVEISSDLHDDVGGLLSGLAMQTELMELTADDSQKERMQRISDMSRSAMSRMRDTVWAIDARKDKIEDVLDRIREHAEEILVPRGINYEIQAGQLDSKLHMNARNRQAVYLICKEAISNIGKHSTGDQVLIQLSISGKRLRARIHDNGNVAVKHYKTTGLGLSNMKMRAEKAGGSIEFDASDGFAVNFELDIRS